MASYSYRGLDSQGGTQIGQIEAVSEKVAVSQLRERSIFVMQITEGESIAAPNNLRTKLQRFRENINLRRYLWVSKGDLILLFRQIALMLRAGHTLVATLEAAQGMQSKLRLIRAMKRMSDSIRSGVSLSSSMVQQKRLFSPMVVSLVSIGERSGNLESILDRLAENLERVKELKLQLFSALLYPSIVLISSVSLVAFLVIKVIPRFSTFLTARHSALPHSTQILLDVSNWAFDWSGTIATVTGVGTFLLLAAYTTYSGKKFLDRCLLAVPIVGTAVQFSAMAQAGWSLSLLLRSGLPALDAMRISGEAMENLAVRESFEKAANGLLEGRSVSKTLEQPHIPAMMRHMAAIGEQSGELDTVMQDMGIYYQKELSAKVKFMTVMIEPAMILIVGSIVGYVYYSLFQAIMAVSKGGM
jgi:type II secretory pathway component PulF